jgi:hypothetical protein
MATEFLPLILTNASIKISTDNTPANLKELACVANHIELSPDVSITTLDTMCGSKDYPGTIKWALIATLYQSFDVDATEDVLSAAVAYGDPVAFSVAGYRDKAVGADNPEWTGLVIPQPYSPINGDAGDASSVELEWSLSGAPVKSIGIVATGATAGTPGTFTPAGATPPADLAAMTGITASPATAWTTGQYVVLGDSSHAHWDSSAWAVGDAP